MYGHLDYDLDVKVGQNLARGDRIGAVLARSDDINRSHLHFEMRNFLTKDEVNGDARGCMASHAATNARPVPGYWPMDTRTTPRRSAGAIRPI